MLLCGQKTIKPNNAFYLTNGYKILFSINDWHFQKLFNLRVITSFYCIHFLFKLSIEHTKWKKSLRLRKGTTFTTAIFISFVLGCFQFLVKSATVKMYRKYAYYGNNFIWKKKITFFNDQKNRRNFVMGFVKEHICMKWKGNQFDNKKWETKFPVIWLWIKEGQKPIFNVTLLDDFSRIQGQRNELAYDVGYCS